MTSPDITIRPERPADAPGIHRVLTAAFPTDLEAQLVHALRAAGQLQISLVAVVDGHVAGYVAFSPVTITGRTVGLGLAPVAVDPAFQQQGIGSALIREGLKFAQLDATGMVVVLGEPAYYARFGFRPAAARGLRDEYGGGEAFQAIVFDPGAIPAGGGLVRYGAEFGIFGDEQHGR